MVKLVKDGGHGRVIARTFSLEEANRISENYESQGYDVKIIEVKQGHMKVYDVVVKKEKEGFMARDVDTD